VSALAAPNPRPLRALTVRLDPPRSPGGVLDPIALAGDEGILFLSPDRVLVGRGTAAVFELPRGLADRTALRDAGRWLAGIPHLAQGSLGGPVPIAHAALAFEPDAPGRLVVPEMAYRRESRGEWVTLVGSDPAQLDSRGCRQLLMALARPGLSPEPAEPNESAQAGEGTAQTRAHRGRFPSLTHLHERPPPVAYTENVAAALGSIAEGALRKVVLARCLDAAFTKAIDTTAVLHRLRAQEPSCTAFAMPTPGGRFLGASPELLVARHGAELTAHPLAGTVGLSGDAAADKRALEDFSASAKDREEHRVLVEDIAQAIAPLCRHLEVPDQPSLVRLHSVAHFGTPIRGVLPDSDEGPGPLPGALELAALLHGTAAVGGSPRSAALRLISSLEGAPRGNWAGPVGWTDARGDGDWVIGIRSATVQATTAHLCAGAGIVAGSDPVAELGETTIKLVAVLDALVPGAGRHVA
jgi:menaquinone-specific isochorismate synthase